MNHNDIAVSDMMDEHFQTYCVNCDNVTVELPDSLCFGPGRYTPETGELEIGPRLHRLEPVVADVLNLLLDNAGRVVTRDRILESVWKDRIVVDESISRAISRIRSVLGDTSRPYRYIETLPKRGYRLISSSPSNTSCPG